MTEIKTDNTVIITGKNSSIIKSGNYDAAPAVNSKAVDQKISRGEKWYNWVVYSGINFWVNLIGSVLLADSLTSETGKLRKPFDFTVGKIAKSIEKTGVSIFKAHHNTKVALETLALTGGGWLLLIPMKLMEDRKRKVVHWLNDKMGVDQTAPDGHKLTADEIYIEKEQPKQSWIRVIGRRLLASTIVMTSGSVLDKFAADKSVAEEVLYTRKIDPYSANNKIIKSKADLATGNVIEHTGHLGGKERTTNWLVNDVLGKGLSLFPKGDKLAHRVGALGKFEDSGKLGRLVHLTALDSFFTKITAVTMYLTNGAKRKKMPHEIAAVSTQDNISAVPAGEGTGSTLISNNTLSHAARIKPRSEQSKERFTSHVQKLAMEPEQQLQPNI